ncbi:MAG: methylmalonyl Co-A mutase-associated GTPase MeaB [Paracoccaceae bacterium]
MPNRQDLAKDILSGDRRALARAITLVESTRDDHREQTLALLAELRGASRPSALRLGLSGTPGVGKSTFTDAFGMMLIGSGLRVAVLAVDPSSTRSGGSILGDKTRMERLARERNAFIRPSPSQTALGGVARRTREVIALCEAAAFDVILIETVGVGQSETMVADMSDVFVLLMAPAGGDELQGVKRGIMEIADLILVNKADGDLAAAAARTCADYAGALGLLRRRARDPEGFPVAMTVSAITGDGLAGAWEKISGLVEWRRECGVWERIRAAQAGAWFDDEVNSGILAHFGSNDATRRALRERVTAGEIGPEEAASRILAELG